MAYRDYKCTECEFVFEKNLPYERMLEPESEPCPNCSIQVFDQPNLGVKWVANGANMGDAMRMGVTKPPSDFMHGVVNRIAHSVPGANFDRARFQPSKNNF